MSHTKGPWLRDGNFVYSLMHAGYFRGKEDFKNRMYATIYSDKSVPAEETEANARLIAAAPELLQELQHLVRLMESKERDGGLDIPGLATLNAARAAIAKSTGHTDKPSDEKTGSVDPRIKPLVDAFNSGETES